MSVKLTILAGLLCLSLLCGTGCGGGASTPPVTPPSAPVITSFTPSSATISSGQSVTLRWSITGATQITIDNGVGDVTGLTGKTVSPTATTTYRITATNSGGTVTATTTVTVNIAPPVISSFSASPTSITNGQSSTLRWTVTGATQLSINQSIGDVTGQTSRVVSPTATTTYTLTARNSGGSVTSNATVTVTGSVPVPVISSFTASPTSISSGQSSTLSWSVSGSTSLSINQGIGTVTGSTSRVVSPTATTTYTLSATNSGGTVTANATVSVVVSGTVRIGFLHHSTGGNIWGGGVLPWMQNYNAAHCTDYQITERAYPDTPYPWQNYPYDYWNLWVNPSGPSNSTQPGVHNLPTLTANYDVIVFKHCFPVSDIGPDTGNPNVASSTQTVENYKAQYNALKTVLHQYPNKKFIVWTGAALIQSATDATKAQRARDFFTWVKTQWDERGDNIFIWDFYELETEGGLYLKPEYASGDSHPNSTFSQTVAPYFARRVVNVIEGRGDTSRLDGKD